MGRPGGQAIMSKAVTPQTSSATRAGHGTRPIQRAVAAPSVRPATGASPAWGYQIGRLSIQPPVASQPLPQPLRGQMERSFDADFSTVRVAQGPEAARMGTLAFTQGESIHFAPGQLDPHSTSGRRLFAHELAHVLQQRAGLAKTAQGKGAPLHHDADLEAEADRASQKVEAGQQAHVAGVTSTQRHAAPGSTQPPVRQGKAPGGAISQLLSKLWSWFTAPVTLGEKAWHWARGSDGAASPEAAHAGTPEAPAPKEVIEDALPGPAAAAGHAGPQGTRPAGLLRTLGALAAGAAGFVTGLAGTALSSVIAVTGAGISIVGGGLLLAGGLVVGVICGAAAALGVGYLVGRAVATTLWDLMKSMGRLSLATLYGLMTGAHYLLRALAAIGHALNEPYDQLWDYLSKKPGAAESAPSQSWASRLARKLKPTSSASRALAGYIKSLGTGPLLLLGGGLAAASVVGSVIKRMHYLVSGFDEHPAPDADAPEAAPSGKEESRLARWGRNALHLLGFPIMLPVAALVRIGRFTSTLWWMHTGNDLVDDADQSTGAIGKLIGLGLFSVPILLWRGLVEVGHAIRRWVKDPFGKEATKYSGAVAGIGGVGAASYFTKFGKPSGAATEQSSNGAAGAVGYEASSAGGYAAMGMGSLLNFGDAAMKYWNARKRAAKAKRERDAAASRIGKRDMRNAGFSMATAMGSMVTSAMTMASYFTRGREATMGMQQFQQYASGSAVSFAGNVFTSVGAGASIVGGAINLATGLHGLWSARRHSQKLDEKELKSDAAIKTWLPHIRSQLGWRKRLLSLKSIGGAIGIAAGALLIASNPVGWALGAAAAVVGTGFVVAKIVKRLHESYKRRKAQEAAPPRAGLSAEELKQHGEELARKISKNAQVAGEMIDALRLLQRGQADPEQTKTALDAIQILAALGIRPDEALSASGQELLQLRLGRMHGV